MAYTVLARKYRSRTFDEVVGQSPIATTLSNAISSGRIHHGYLFTGTRGVGKTSMARILAKALNCLKADGPTVKPCLECDSCVAIGEGQDIDVVEIDAASNTGVDNIRELRANAAFRPARARFKIYIIDEVHMLSTGAFNALLKTLEEPPEHVKFILATTEIQKVPATIRSRCQCFNFRNIGAAEIAGLLARVARDEGAVVDDAAAARIARLANGSMRDALSILDQLLSVSPQRVSAEVLDEILPPAQDEQVFALLSKAAAGDVPGALAAVDAALAGGRGLEVLCTDTIELVRSLMMIRACGPDAVQVDIPAGSRDAYVSLAAQFELSQHVQIIAMLEELRRNVRFSGAGRALTDALVVRLANLRRWAPIEQLVARFAAAADDEPVEKKKPLATVMPFAAQPVAPVLTDPEPRAGATTPQRSVRRPLPADASIAVAVAPAAQATRVEHWDSAGDIDDFAQPVAEEPLSAPPPDAPAPARESAGDLVPASAELRREILNDPVVQQAMDLFSGSLVNLQRVVNPAPPAAEIDSEG